VNLEHLIEQYGLAAVLIGSAIEGDFTLILAGVFAHLGYFPFPLALAAGVLGSYVGDFAWYLLGRLRGPHFRAGRLYQRVGAAQLIAARFVYGTKAASMVFWGLHGMPVVRFAIVDAIACVIGALVFAGLGYGVSGSATVLLGHVRRVQFWLLGALVVGAVLVVLIHLAAKRELHLEDADQ
jgi:membrane protein DedA with SNARE-associated domain